MSDKTITLSLMDPPYDSETTTTALRIAEAALDKALNRDNRLGDRQRVVGIRADPGIIRVEGADVGRAGQTRL